MKTSIKAILTKELPSTFNIVVQEYNNWGEDYIKILFSPNTYQINNVKGQFPQAVSLCLNLKTLELMPQVFGGMGGQDIYIKPEKGINLVMQSVKVPFRKPTKSEPTVLNAVRRFAQNYMKILQENKETLKYSEFVDYSFLN